MQYADLWRARFEGLADVLHEVWRRGVEVGGVPGFDATKPCSEQEHEFDKRFRPWKHESRTLLELQT